MILYQIRSVFFPNTPLAVVVSVSTIRISVSVSTVTIVVSKAISVATVVTGLGVSLRLGSDQSGHGSSGGDEKLHSDWMILSLTNDYLKLLDSLARLMASGVLTIHL